MELRRASRWMTATFEKAKVIPRHFHVVILQQIGLVMELLSRKSFVLTRFVWLILRRGLGSMLKQLSVFGANSHPL